jgi:hypothetical protein
MRTQLGVEDGRGVVSVPYAMPLGSLCVGAFVGHRSLGTTAIGYVIWVVPGSAAPRDPGVQANQPPPFTFQLQLPWVWLDF